MMKRIAFNIETALGRKHEVHGYEVVPGVAVHKSDSWQVTHSPSGLLLQNNRQSFCTRKEAVAYAQRLVQMFSSVDWLASAEAVDEAMRKAIKLRYKSFLVPRVYEAIQELVEGKKPTHKLRSKRKKKAQPKPGSCS